MEVEAEEDCEWAIIIGATVLGPSNPEDLLILLTFFRCIGRWLNKNSTEASERAMDEHDTLEFHTYPRRVFRKEAHI